MKREELIAQIRTKKSFLCIGLDTDINKLPKHFKQSVESVLKFNQEIVDATAPYCVAYKPNSAFYEAMGAEGVKVLQATIAYIKAKYPEQMVILDAKRGDIGNTSTMYAQAAFEDMEADAVTIAPYMGSDSVKPFLAYKEKWSIVLTLTSNVGSKDFQHLLIDGEPLYKQILKQVSGWGSEEQLMFVAGATQATLFEQIREIVPHHFLLVPGVGAQGGSLAEVCKYGMTAECGLLVNSSRSIIYASEEEDFATKAKEAAKLLQQEMAEQLANKGVI